MNRYLRPVLLAAAVASCAAAAALAEEGAAAARRGADPAPAREAARTIAPEKAYLDFATGQFREVTPEDLVRIEKMRTEDAAAAASGSPGVVEHGHGMRSAVLPDSYHLALAVRERPDGTLEIVCAPNRSVGRRLAAPLRPRAEER